VSETHTALPSSFRDARSGFVFRYEGKLYRQVNEAARADYDALMSSGLYGELVGEGLLIEHEEVELAGTSPGAYKILQPTQLPFISYPYEWSFGQLKDAALATIEIQKRALAKRMSLRDASSYNMQFHAGRFVLIDTLSFEVRQEGRPWIAYRQFCQHFLAPLALMSYRDVRLNQLLRVYIDGAPLDLAAALLPGKARTRIPLQLHIFSHAKAQLRGGGGPSGSGKSPSISENALIGIVDSLRKGVEGLDLGLSKSTWSDYYDEADHYSSEAFENKKRLVESYIDEIAPTQLWDLGANVGLFSRVASAKGIFTVAWELDPQCVERNYRDAKKEGETQLLPLVLDLSNPSPGMGWANQERDDLAGRGPADAIMALALIHHLAIGNNVPLTLVAAYIAKLGRRLIIEFVPKDDPKVQELLSSREDIFDDYSVAGFEAAFGEHFTILRHDPVAGSSRVLYLMESKAA
jgi:hypothetical protein